MAYYSTEAINLSSRKFGEADKLMTFFTKEKGKVCAIAKSALKPGSKFGGRLEIFAYNELLLGEGRNLDILSQAETIETFSSIKNSEEKLKAGFYMVKLVDSFLPVHAKNEALFNFLKDSLCLLRDANDVDCVLRTFDIRFADLEGFLPLYIASVKKDALANNISVSEKNEIDSVLAPFICEHVGKDVRLWKSM